MTRIIIHGCNGKMGQVVAAMAQGDPELEIAAGVDMNADALVNDFPVYSRIRDCREEADVIIDFSSPEALSNLLEGAVAMKSALIIATTGLGKEDLVSVERASRSIPVFRSANMSLGINLMYDLAKKSASVFGRTFDIEIIEKHHNLKADAPSGTALALAEVINQVFLDEKEFIFGRHGKKEKRTPAQIGIHAVRGGTIVGEHHLLFAGKDEVFQIVHTAYSRQIFASGALAAAKYLKGKPAGFYTMQDILTEKSAVTDLSVYDDEAMVTVNSLPDDPLVIAGLFRKIADENINVDIISQTAPIDGKVEISFTLPEKQVDSAASLLEDLKRENSGADYVVERDIAKISVEGVGMERQSGVAAKVFELMAEKNIKIKTVTTSETKITYVIDWTNKTAAVEAIREGFNLRE